MAGPEGLRNHLRTLHATSGLRREVAENCGLLGCYAESGERFGTTYQFYPHSSSEKRVGVSSYRRFEEKTYRSDSRGSSEDETR
jgi:hypothetical protein